MNDSLFVFYRFINICVVIQFSLLGISQNLVPNSGFDEFTNCPVGQAGLDGYVNDWYIVKDSPDYYNSCNASSFGTPNNISGHQIPRSGNSYMGAATYSAFNNIFIPMEMFQVKLKYKLIAGKKYCVTYYVNPANESGYFTDCLDAYFSPTPEIYPNIIVDGSIEPQINTSGNIIEDTAVWTEISGNFIANGGEEYMTLGCFKTIYDIDTIRNSPASSIWQSNAYYFFDDVSVIFCDKYDIEFIEVPNIFTPNGDGINDVLNILFPVGYNDDLHVTIYNRWGERIYKSNKISIEPWNGKNQWGNIVSTGVYYYVLFDGKNTKSGSIHVVY